MECPLTQESSVLHTLSTGRMDPTVLLVAIWTASFVAGFISQTSFRYGVRSIAHLIDEISIDAFRNNNLIANALSLPVSSEELLQGSSLKFHLVHKNEGFGIVNGWKQVLRDLESVSVKKAPAIREG